MFVWGRFGLSGYWVIRAMETSESRSIGRPSKYNADLQALADSYIFNYPDQGDVIPSHAGLACWIGIAKSTLYEWAKIYPDFSDTLDAILVKQETVTLNKGLSGVFNPTISKLVLANHGYSEKIETAHTSPDGSMTPKPAIDAAKLSDAALREIAAARIDADK